MLLHPLSGSDPATLISVLRANGPIPARQWHRVVLAMAASVSRAPFSVIERGMVPMLTARAGEREPPVFILGHWRSGTTHLYNTLAASGRFGYVSPVATGLPWDVLVLGRLLRPLLSRLLPAQRYIDRIPVHPDSPQEDEAALANMQPISFYHGLYFPHRLRENFNAGVFFDGCSEAEVARWQRRFEHLLDKMHVLNAGRRLLIKNPVYTARVAMLKRMLPGAKFIHIHRDPVMVFVSMRHFYSRLLDVMGLQSYDPGIIDELILESYPRMMRKLIDEASELPASDFVEAGYDALDERPLPLLERIYDQLGLGDFEADRASFERYLEATRNYQKNRFDVPEDVQRLVRERWGPFMERWGSGSLMGSSSG